MRRDDPHLADPGRCACFTVHQRTDPLDGLSSLLSVDMHAPQPAVSIIIQGYVLFSRENAHVVTTIAAEKDLSFRSHACQDVDVTE